MQLFRFDAQSTVDGNAYSASQVVSFGDHYDLSQLPGSLVASAHIFVDHVPRVEAPPSED
jgi:hypothetical protein